ncbi:Zinc finger, C2H2 type [Popillia japonica]|uniref:Zinc finger, C2H2 type n=1 Tax=Popillia japonica TaxID=7064 RepID=A0AAW1I990_POPJA
MNQFFLDYLQIMHSPAIFEPEISMKSHTYKPDPDALPDVKPEFNCDLPTREKSSKSQMCKICGKVLSSPSSYYVHMKVHSGNKPFGCTQCEATFCRKAYLEVHMRTHTDGISELFRDKKKGKKC